MPGSAVIAGQLWVFGGGNPFLGSGTAPTFSKKGVFAPDTTNILQVYDPATNTWSSGPNLNQQRSFPAGTHVGDTAVAVGGYTGSTTTTSVEINVAGGGGTPTPTPTGTPAGCTTYTTSTGSGTITPGDTDTGSHCDDCDTTISFPFPVSVYGQIFNSADVSSNGTLNLIGGSRFVHPWLSRVAGCELGQWPFSRIRMTSEPMLIQDVPVSLAETVAFSPQPPARAPNRQFNIEWRVVHFADTAAAANFSLVFYENDSSFFDVFYGATSDNGLDETSGVQASSAGPATTFSCAETTLTDGLKVTYTCAGGGGSPTPTPTPTGTPGGCINKWEP